MPTHGHDQHKCVPLHHGHEPAFQGDDYNQNAAEKASHTLYGLSFGPKCNMTADRYVAEFLTQVNIIAKCGDPIEQQCQMYFW